MATTPSEEIEAPPPSKLRGVVVNSGRFFEVPISFSAHGLALQKELKNRAVVDDIVSILVAKTSEGSWLTLSEQDVCDLEDGQVPDSVRDAMIPQNTIHPFVPLESDFRAAPQAGDEIHLLVRTPGPLRVYAKWLPVEARVWTLESCQLRLVDRNEAIQKLLKIHFSHFQGSSCRGRDQEWPIPLVEIFMVSG